MQSQLIHDFNDYNKQDIVLIKKWTALAAKKGLLVERSAWLEAMIQQGHMYALKENNHIVLFFLLRHLFTINNIKIGVSQNGLWQHPHTTYGPMTGQYMIKKALELDFAITFIAIYQNNTIGNRFLSENIGFTTIAFDQVNPDIFSNNSFQPNPNTMFLKYYSPFDATFLKEKSIIL